MTWLSQLFQTMARPFRWWVVVAPWERGVRVRLGRTAKELAPGPHLRIPFLDRVYVQSVRLRTLTMMSQTITTRDMQTVTLSFAVQFKIRNILTLYDSVSNPDETLRTLVSSRVAEFMAETDAAAALPKHVEAAVNEEIADFAEWGLSGLEFRVTSYAKVKTYRLLMNEYQSGAGLHNLEDDNSGERA